MKIIIIGFFGSGKSLLAKNLSKILKIPYISLDQKIEKICKSNIDNIFNTKGILYFRKLEYKELKKTLQLKQKYIIDTGGGIVDYQPSYKLLKDKKLIKVFINKPFNRCYYLSKKDKKSRPLLKLYNKNDLKKIYNQRKKKFLRLANVVVNNKKINVSPILIRKIDKILDFTF